MRGKIVVLTVMIFAIVASVFSCGMATQEGIELVVLMYHNILPDSCTPSKYEVTLSGLGRDMQYIKDKGYTVVSAGDVIKYTRDKNFKLPNKCVMLTFDDGFYAYNRYLGGLLEKYDMTAVVSVVGEFTKYNKTTNATARYTYMDYDDMVAMQSTGRVEIATHSNNLHKLGRRKGANMFSGENEVEYRKVFMDDTAALEGKLRAVGIVPTCYTYPYGAYCKQSEKFIKERGYKMSLTCNELVNRITKDPNDLYSLGRYNRHGSLSSAEKILSKAMPIKP